MQWAGGVTGGGDERDRLAPGARRKPVLTGPQDWPAADDRDTEVDALLVWELRWPGGGGRDGAANAACIHS